MRQRSVASAGAVQHAVSLGVNRIVVAIDPAVSVSENSDETGIVVCGLGQDGDGYVLEDASGKYPPLDGRSARSRYIGSGTRTG